MASRRRDRIAGLAPGSDRGLAGAAGADRRPGRSRLCRLDDRRSGRRTRILYRHPPPLAGPDPSAGRNRAEARAGRAHHLGHAQGRGRMGQCRSARWRDPSAPWRPTVRGKQPIRLSGSRRSADRHRHQTRRHRRAVGRLWPFDRGGRRRDAGPVHRHPSAARGPCPHRRSTRTRGPAALCPACRSDGHRNTGRYFPRRSARVPAGHRRAARRGRCARPFVATGGDGGRAMVQAHGVACRAPIGRRG